jgi:hypothetical protein
MANAECVHCPWFLGFVKLIVSDMSSNPISVSGINAGADSEIRAFRGIRGQFLLSISLPTD